MWQTVDFSNPNANPSFKGLPMTKFQTFQLLLFKPFYFFLSPIGFSWTVGVLFVIYCILIGIYLNLEIHSNDKFPMYDDPNNPDKLHWKDMFEVIVWTCGFGYIAHEVKEYLDQGATYFTVNLSNNIWDIYLSINFVILLAIRVFGGVLEIGGPRSRQAYDILWALQCVVLSIRSLVFIYILY